MRDRSCAHRRRIRAVHSKTSALARRSRDKEAIQTNVASDVDRGPRIEENLDKPHLKSLRAKDIMQGTGEYSSILEFARVESAR